jgi:hypothetical protein
MRRTIALAAAICTLSAPVSAVGGEAPFEGSVARIDDETRALMTGKSWHDGCPVPLDDLRMVRVTYWGFDEEAHRGRVVIHRRWADEILEVFRRLYERRFPIRRIRLVDRYDADDRASMRHGNTSAFNCRYISGTTTWSQHAYGRAIDVNPVENPYVVGSSVSPQRGRRFVDRDPAQPGMIAERDVVWRAFHRIGWEWGGTWTSSKDYQHFSANGH